MKWESHKKITGIAAKIIGLSSKAVKLLTDASILPDKDPDYEVRRVKRGNKTVEKKYRLRHHDNPRTKKLIFKYAREARKKYKSGDLEEIWTQDLGRACHYVQDYVVNVHRKILFFKVKDMNVHDKFERRLTREEVPYEDMKKIAREDWYPSKFKSLVDKTLKESKTPQEAMYRASLVTTALIKLVTKPRVPREVFEKYRKWKIIFASTVITTSAFFGASLATGNLKASVITLVLLIVSLTNPVFWKYYEDVHW